MDQLIHEYYEKAFLKEIPILQISQPTRMGAQRAALLEDRGPLREGQALGARGPAVQGVGRGLREEVV